MEKKLPVFNLEITSDLEDDVEVDVVSLVDRPAIERSFMMFKDEQFINPSKGEHKDEFLPRCIAYVINEGKESQQAVAICNSIWTEHFAGEKISFDFDDTLSTQRGQELAMNKINAGAIVYIISARNSTDGMFSVADELGIPHGRVYAMGSNKAKIEKIKKLGISKHYDNNADVIAELGAIGEKFAEASYNDYPEAAVNNAKRALKWAEENGWGSCGEATGKVRANQIANKENLTRETIARISGFRRHQQNKDVAYGEGCGGLMWDAWGGDAMIDWSERKLKQIDRQTFAIQNEEERIISGPLMLADTPIYRNDDNGEYYVVFTKETIKKIAQRFFKKGYQSNVNLMHEQGSMTEGLTMFESWLKDDKRGIKAMKGFEDVPDGSWFGSFKVDNDEVWAQIKAGKVRGFSVEGQFNYRKTGDKKMEQLWANVLDVLAQIG